MSHYDTLGVGVDATPEEVKNGYRRAAARSHPDKGGSDEQMAKVNKAYQVLSDPQARSHYDQTGDDSHQTQGPNGANQLLMKVFQDAIEECSGDILDYCTERLNAGLSVMEERAKKAERSITKLEKKRDRLRRKTDGENLFVALLDSRIAEERDNVETAARVGDQFREAITLLKDYESTYVAEPPEKGIGGITAAEMLEMLNSKMDPRGGAQRYGFDLGSQHRRGRF